jgi:hypothetical protein
MFQFAPEGSEVYTWNPATGLPEYAATMEEDGIWSSNLEINPGEAVFMKASESYDNYMTGLFYTNSVYTPLSSSGKIATGSAMPMVGGYANSSYILSTFDPSSTAFMWTWDVGEQDFGVYTTYSCQSNTWGSSISIAPGEGFFLQQIGTPDAWTRSFNDY